MVAHWCRLLFNGPILEAVRELNLACRASEGRRIGDPCSKVAWWHVNVSNGPTFVTDPQSTELLALVLSWEAIVSKDDVGSTNEQDRA